MIQNKCVMLSIHYRILRIIRVKLSYTINKKAFICFLLIIDSISFAISQNYSLRGIVVDKKGESLSFSTVQILSIDSVTVLNCVTNLEGEFRIDNIKSGKYNILIQYLGFEPYEAEIAINEDVNLGHINLQEASIKLETVVVKGVRPSIRKTLDRYILSFKNTYIGGKNTLDLLQYAPGVTFDRNNNILLNHQNAAIIVNNRELRLKGEQLNDYLKNINSQTIESIEIMSNPTASVDAEGTGGVIQINLKKDMERGFSGFTSSSYSQGRYPIADQNAGFILRVKKITMYGNYTYNFSYPYLKQYVINKHNNSDWTSFYDSKKVEVRHSHTYHWGMEYNINKKHRASVVIDGNNTNSINHLSNANTCIYSKNKLDTIVKGIFPKESKLRSIGVNFNYIVKFKQKEDNELKIIGDYFNANTNSSDFYKSTYFSQKNLTSPIKVQERKSHNENKIRIYSMKADYNFPISKTNKIEIGAKYSNVYSSNDNMFYIKPFGKTNYNIDRKNIFSYKENISALYAVFKGKIKKVEFSTGLRGEYTDYKIYSDNVDISINNNYLQLFPTIFLSYDVNKIDKIIFNYNRRIWRPPYRILNPFEYLIDEYTIKRGNPNITPSYSNNIELSYLYKNRFSFSIKYRYQDDAIGEYYYRDVNTNMTTLSYNNLATSGAYSLSIFAPFILSDWWRIDNHLNLEYSKYEDASFSVHSFPFSYRLNQYFNLPTGFNIDLSFYYSPGGATYLYTTYTTDTYNLGLSINKSFFNKKLEVRLYVNDIFNRSGKFEALDKYKDQYIHNNIDKDRRRIGLALRYNLNRGKKVKSLNFEKSNSEEINRK